MATKRKTVKRKAPAKKKALRKKAAKSATSKKRVTKKRAVKKKGTQRPSSKKRPAARRAAAKPAKVEPAPKAGEPVELTRKAEWSISQFWLNTGFARETVRKRFAEAGVKPSKMVRGYPVFMASAGLPVLYQGLDGEMDPDKLKPFERRAYYQGELDKLKLQAERGELVTSFEMEAAVGRIIKAFVHYLETLPDILERDVGLSKRQLISVEKQCDEGRESLYRELSTEPESDADSTTEERS